MSSFFISAPNLKTHSDPGRSYWPSYWTVLTEAPLFGAQERAVRRAEGPLQHEMEQKHNSPFIQMCGPAIWQQLVIKLTSQQARALPPASRSIVVHSGGKSFFHWIPGQKAELGGDPFQQPWRWEMGTVAGPLCQALWGGVLKGQPFNPWQPWRTETDLLFVFDVVPLSRHIHPEDRTKVHAKASDHCWAGFTAGWGSVGSSHRLMCWTPASRKCLE